jgi:hypothetical protein
MTQLNITSPNEAAIDQVVKESGLVLTEATEIKGAYLPFLSQLQEVVEQAGKINADNPTDIDEKIARELRLKSVKIRTGSEKLKDERKKIYLVKGNLEQASYNVIKNSCLLAEAALEEVEKAREKKEAARKEALRIDRLDMLKPYCDNPEFYPLGEMDESGFNDLLNGMKLQAEAKAKAEQDRLEALRLEEERKQKQIAIDKLTQERRIVLLGYMYAYLGEGVLGEMSEEEFEAVKTIAVKDYEAIKKEEQRIKEENEALRKQKEADDAKAKQLAKEANDKLLIEKEKSDRLAKELKAKQDKEEQDKKDAEAAEKKRIADEKKLAKAPDKDKLNRWVDSFDIADIPTGLSNESGTKGLEISNKFDAFKKWAKEQIEVL